MAAAAAAATASHFPRSAAPSFPSSRVFGKGKREGPSGGRDCKRSLLGVLPSCSAGSFPRILQRIKDADVCVKSLNSETGIWLCGLSPACWLSVSKRYLASGSPV